MTIVEGKSSHSGELVGGFSHGSKDSIVWLASYST